MYSPQFDVSSGRRAAYFLRPENGVSQLFTASLPAGAISMVVSPPGGGDNEANLSLEEKLRRERSRQLSVGITSFVVLPQGLGLVFPQGGDLWIVRPTSGGAAAEPAVLVSKATGGSSKGGPLIDPKASPDGSSLAYVQDNDVYVVGLPAAGAALPAAPLRGVAVTSTGGNGDLVNGLADYVSAEELDRQTGYWWAPSGRAIVFQQTDDSHVPRLRIIHAGAEPASSTADETHRYPFAGEANPLIRLGVVAIPTPEALAEPSPAPLPPVSWLDLGASSSPDFYVPRVTWARDGALLVQVLNRDQTVLDIVAFAPQLSALASPSAGPVCGTLLHREVTDDSDKGWLNCSDAVLTVLPSQNEGAPLRFVVGSERSGFQHLYLYTSEATSTGDEAYSGVPSSSGAVSGTDGSATLLGALTCGEWVVEGVSHVPASPQTGGRELLLVAGAGNGPLQRHLYAIPLPEAGGAPVPVADPAPLRLSSGPGMHSAAVSPDGLFFADTLSSLHGPPSLAVYEVTYGTGATAGAPVPVAAAKEESPAKLASSAAYHRPLSTLFGAAYVHSALVSFGGEGGYGEAAVAQMAGLAASSRLVCVGHGSLPTPPDSGNPAEPAAWAHHLASLATVTEAQDARRGSAGVGVRGARRGSDASSIADEIDRDITHIKSEVGKAVNAALSKASEAQASLMSKATEAVAGFSSFGGGFGSLTGAFASLLMAPSGSEEADAGPDGRGSEDGAPVPMDMGSFMSGSDEEGGRSASRGAEEGDSDEVTVPIADAMLPRAPAPIAAPSSGAVVDDTASGSPSAATPALVVPARPKAPSPTASSVRVPSYVPAPLSSLPPGPVAPLLVCITTADNASPMYGSLHLPDASVWGPGPYPTLISVYGGPHVQRVKHEFATTNDVRAQAMRKAGFLVATVSACSALPALCDAGYQAGTAWHHTGSRLSPLSPASLLPTLAVRQPGQLPAWRGV